MKKTLKKLECCNDSAIDQNGISELNLIMLYATGNEKIKNVNHMKDTLKKLSCSYGCGINRNSMTKLNLFKLYANENTKF